MLMIILFNLYKVLFLFDKKWFVIIKVVLMRVKDVKYCNVSDCNLVSGCFDSL